MKHFLMMSAILIAASGCGSTTSETKSVSLSYDYTLNGCNTGKQTFSSQDEYCAGLQDESRNRFCALEMRKQDFDQRCAGRDWNPR